MAIVAPVGSTPTPAPDAAAMEDFAKALGGVLSGAPPGAPAAPPDGTGAGKEAAIAGPIAPSQEPDFFPAPGTKPKTTPTVDAALALQLLASGGIVIPVAAPTVAAVPRDAKAQTAVAPAATIEAATPAVAIPVDVEAPAVTIGATPTAPPPLGQIPTMAISHDHKPQTVVAKDTPQPDPTAPSKPGPTLPAAPEGVGMKIEVASIPPAKTSPETPTSATPTDLFRAPTAPTEQAKVDAQTPIASDPAVPVEAHPNAPTASTPVKPSTAAAPKLESNPEATPQAPPSTKEPEKTTKAAREIEPDAKSDGPDPKIEPKVEAKPGVLEIQPKVEGDQTQPVALSVKTKPDAAPLPPREAQLAVMQVADRLHMLAATRAKGGVVIHLQPGHLGTITLTVRTEGGALRADIAASNDAVRIALEQNRPTLGAALHDSRLNLDNVTISTPTQTPQWGTGAAPQQQRQPSSQSQSQSRHPAPRTPTTVPMEIVAARPAISVGGVGVDLWI